MEIIMERSALIIKIKWQAFSHVWYACLNYRRDRMPEVSIVIPFYNKTAYIARALNSILTQTIQDFEEIMVDGNFINNGAAVIRGFFNDRVKCAYVTEQRVKTKTIMLKNTSLECVAENVKKALQSPNLKEIVKSRSGL